MKRYDLALIEEFDKRYVLEILQPVLEAISEVLKGKIVAFTPALKKKIRQISKLYGIRLETLLSNTLSKTELTARSAFFEEIQKSVPKKFRYGKSEYQIFAGSVYKMVGTKWIDVLETNSTATRNWLKFVAEDGFTLSDRIWKNVTQFKAVMENTIARNIQMGKSARSLGSQILKSIEQQPIQLSKKMQEYISQMAPADAEKVISKYVKKKQRYNAMRVARTEIQRAYRTSYLAQAKKLPFVKGVKWNRSRTEYYCEICQFNATADLYELGPGVYPPDKAPIVPHPHCRCYYTTVLKI